MKIGFYQGHGYLGEIDKNIDLIEKVSKEAKKAKSDIVVFPELFTTGYNLSKALFEEICIAYDFKKILSKLARKEGISIIAGFAHQDQNGQLFNSVGCFDHLGQCLHIHDKAILWGEEKTIFKAGANFESFTFRGITIGMIICFETEFVEPCKILANQGAQIIFSVVSNAHDGYNQNLSDVLVPTRAMENRVFLLYCNRSGKENDYTYTGKSTLANPYGQIIQQCNETQSTLKLIDIDVNEVQQSRDYFSYHQIIKDLNI